MSTARAEGSGLVPVAASHRRFDGRVYSPAQCVGQLAENSAAKGKLFNASNFWVYILPRYGSFTRAPGTDVGVPSDSQALKVVDDGSGFGYEEVETMLSYGTPQGAPTDKKFGANNHGLKAVAATLGPACSLLFSKNKRPDGLIWHTVLAIGDNFDRDGWYSYRRLAWPASFQGNFEEYAANNFFMCGSAEVCQDLFRTVPGGKTWATMKDLSIAHKHFEEIKDTGVLAIFPFGQEQNNIKAEIQDEDIKMQGVSLKELLTKYFVAPELGLLEPEYWDDYKNFKMHLSVKRKKKIPVKPQPPEFEMSPPISVTIDQATHKVVYGPYYSPKRTAHDLFPYAHDVGSKLYNQNYEFYLASNSRIMNPLHGPKLSDNGGTRTDYMGKQRTSQKGAGTIMRQLLGTLCGEQLDTQTPEAFEELDELLQQYGVFDNKNPYLQRSDEYSKQMKNLKWLLGNPFLITAKIDTDYLQFNDAKDDLRDDALKRDAFFAAAHLAVALDVMKRMVPGFERLKHDVDQAKPDKQLKVDKLFKAGKSVEAAAPPPPPTETKKSGSKRKATAPIKRVPQTAQQAQHEEQQEAEQAQRAEQAEQAGPSNSNSDPAAAVLAAAIAAATASDTVSDAGPAAAEDLVTSARAARLQARTDGTHTLQLASPSDGHRAKRRRGSASPERSAEQHQGLDVLAAAAEEGVPAQSSSKSRSHTVSRSLLDLNPGPASSCGEGALSIQRFDDLWREAASQGAIQECATTRTLHQLMLDFITQHSS